MRTVYAIQVEIGGEPAEALDDMVARLSGWAARKYRDRWDTKVDFPADGGDVSPLENHSLRVQRLRAAAGELFSLEWAHPDDRDPSLRWTTVCQVARGTEQLQMQLSLRVASAAFDVRPVRFQFGRPGVIAQILKELPCSVRGAPVRTTPRSLGAPFVADFVQDELLDKARPLPVVVLSPGETGRPPIESASLQERIMGHAQVVVLEDKWAGYKLTNALGKDLSCFHGYGRLYWPGLEPGADPRRFPLYAPATLQWVDRIGRDFPRRLFEQLAAVASFRLVEGHVIRSVREAAEAERAAHLEALRRDRASRSDFEELLEVADEEIKELQGAKQNLESQVDDLQSQLATARANLEATWRDSGDQDLEENARAPVGLQIQPILSSAREALDQAESDFGDVLRIYESARESAAASGFPRPDDVYQALQEIADLGRAYFGSEDRKVGRWDQHLSFEYAATESQTTRTKHGGARIFRRGDGEQKQMLRHITLGGADKVNCLQIYFEPDDETGTMEIGYCGEHLPYAKQRT